MADLLTLIIPNLWISNYAQSQRKSALDELQITHIIAARTLLLLPFLPGY